MKSSFLNSERPLFNVITGPGSTAAPKQPTTFSGASDVNNVYES